MGPFSCLHDHTQHMTASVHKEIRPRYAHERELSNEPQMVCVRSDMGECDRLEYHHVTGKRIERFDARPLLYHCKHPRLRNDEYSADSVS